MEAFQQHPAIELAGMGDRLGHVVDAGQVYRYALALFAVNGLDHHRAMLVEKGQVIVGITGQLLRRHLQPGSAQGMLGQALVLAQVMVTALVRSLSDSRQRMRRPPRLRVNSPPAASSTCTSMPRRNASSTMMRA